MNRPSDADIDDLIEQLRKTDWRKLGARLKAANRADASGGTPRITDGYPTGGGGPSSKNAVGRPTEQAMLAGYVTPKGEDGPGFFAARRDEARDHVENAWAFLQQTAHSADACAGRLDLFDRLRGDVPDPVWCEYCLEAGRQVPMALSTAVEMDGVPVLPRLVDMCIAHMHQVRRRRRPPTVEETLRMKAGD